MNHPALLRVAKSKNCFYSNIDPSDDYKGLVETFGRVSAFGECQLQIKYFSTANQRVAKVFNSQSHRLQPPGQAQILVESVQARPSYGNCRGVIPV